MDYASKRMTKQASEEPKSTPANQGQAPVSGSSSDRQEFTEIPKEQIEAAHVRRFKPGNIRKHKGQRYLVKRLVPYLCVGKAPNRRQTLLVELETACSVCGDRFEFLLSALRPRFEPAKRCKKHRAPGVSSRLDTPKGAGTAPRPKSAPRALSKTEMERRAVQMRRSEKLKLVEREAKAKAEKVARKAAALAATLRQRNGQEEAEAKRISDIRQKVDAARRKREVPVQRAQPLTVFD